MRIRSAVIAALVAVSTLAVDAAPMRAFALVFGAATTDRVNISSTAAMSDLTTWSLLTLVYRTSSAAMPIFSKGGNTANTRRINLRINATGALATTIDGSTDLVYQTSTTPMAGLNQWLWVVAVADLSAGASAKIRYYTSALTNPLTLQTLAAAPTEGAGYLSDSGAAAHIGNNGNPDTAFVGQIAFVALSSQKLEIGELEAIRRNWRSGSFRGALGAWVVGGNGTGPVFDLTGNGNVGTRTGAIPSGQAPPRMVWRRPT